MSLKCGFYFEFFAGPRFHGGRDNTVKLGGVLPRLFEHL